MPTRCHAHRAPWLLMLLLGLWSCGESTDPGGTAEATGPDLIIVNAIVHTGQLDRPRAAAMAVTGGRVTALGSRAEIEALAGAPTEVIDAQGAAVTPGFVDSHIHVRTGARLVTGVDLYGIPDKASWLDRIAARARELPPGEWLLGGRWDYTLAEGELPTRQDLDAVVPDRPVALTDIDYHTTWINSAAMNALGITAETPVPPGGEIQLDPVTGEPTGILLESAESLVYDAIEAGESVADRRQALRQTLAYLNRQGITSIHDMSGDAVLDDYAALLDAGELDLRVWYGVPMPDSAAAAGAVAERREHLAERFPADPERGPLLALGFVKGIIDGVLSTHTAAMLEPYADRPETRGEPFYSLDELRAQVAAATGAGLPVAIHAIGDRGVSMALTAYAEAAAAVPVANRIEHIEVTTPEDVARFAELGVAASMQPNHATGTIGKYITQRLGPERERYAYVWQDMLRAGVQLAISTDWPTAPVEPMVQLADAVLRESPTGLGDGPWYPDNALTLDQALHAYTQGGADLTTWAAETGALAPGHWADFVIWDGPLPDPVDRTIVDREVQATYLAGRAVYRRDAP